MRHCKFWAIFLLTAAVPLFHAHGLAQSCSDPGQESQASSLHGTNSGLSPWQQQKTSSTTKASWLMLPSGQQGDILPIQIFPRLDSDKNQAPLDFPASPQAEIRKKIDSDTQAQKAQDQQSDNEQVLGAAHLTADKVEVNDETVSAQGNVAIDIMGARLLCDFLTLDRVTGQIQASGDCVLYWNDNFAACDWMSCDPRSSVAVLHEVKGQGRDFGAGDTVLNSDILFWAKTMQWNPGKITLDEATLTTCDAPSDELDYKFTSKFVEIYPEQQMIANNASIYIHDKHIYTLPTMNVSLDPNKDKRRQPFPQLGSNSVDGFFARTSFDYLLNQKDYGSILFDYYSKTGIGAGVQQIYHLGDKGSGNFYVYRLSGDTIDDRYEISNSLSYNFDDDTRVEWDINANRSETPGFSTPSNINSTFKFKHTTETSDLRFSHNYNKRSDNRNTTWRLYYDLMLTPELSGMVNAEIASIATSRKTAQRFHYEAGLRHVSDLFDTELMVENTTGDASYYLNRNPELILRSNPFYIGDVPLLASAGIGHVTEAPSMFSTNRTDLQLQIPDQCFDYGSGRVLAGAGLRQLFYGSGESLYTLAARAGWLQELGDFGTMRLDYNWLQPKGETPLQHDYMTGYENITGGIEFFQLDKFNLAVIGGYNLKSDRFQNITPRLQFQPADRWLFGAGTSFDPNSGMWRTVDANVKMQLTNEFSVSNWSVYDLVNSRFTYQDYQFDYEAHDWITSLVYRSVQNEFYLQFSLKAFPQAPISIGPNAIDPIHPKNMQNAFVR